MPGHQRLRRHHPLILQDRGERDRRHRRPGRFGRQLPYLGGPGFRERGDEPPPPPPGTGGAYVPATGRASQILSLTSAICSTTTVNSARRAISRRRRGGP